MSRKSTATKVAETTEASIEEVSVEPVVETVEEEKPKKRVGVVNCPLLNVRSKSDITSSIVTQIENGTEVTIKSEKDGFFAVTLGDGTKGFVLSTKIEEK